jgi:hypothetical protein
MFLLTKTPKSATVIARSLFSNKRCFMEEIYIGPYLKCLHTKEELIFETKFCDNVNCTHPKPESLNYNYCSMCGHKLKIKENTRCVDKYIDYQEIFKRKRLNFLSLQRYTPYMENCDLYVPSVHVGYCKDFYGIGSTIAISEDKIRNRNIDGDKK